MKKLLVIALIIALVLSMGITASATTGFSDTNYHWAKDKIEAMTAGGLLNGYPDGSFKPNNPITIAELCTLICQLDGYKPVKTHDYWAYEYIDYCRNVLKCCDNHGDITPANYNVPITREEAVYMIMQSVGSNNRSLMKNGITSSYIPDYADMDGSYRAYVLKAYQQGIVTGMDSAHTFKPKGNFTRAELCTILYQANHTKENPVTATLTNDQIWEKLMAMGIWDFNIAIFLDAEGNAIDTTDEATYKNYLAKYGKDALYCVEYTNYDDFVSGGQVLSYEYGEGGYIKIAAAYAVSIYRNGYDSTTDRFGTPIPAYSNGTYPQFDATTGLYYHPSGFHYESRQLMKQILETALPNSNTNLYELMQGVFSCEYAETKYDDYYGQFADSMTTRWIDGHMVDMLISQKLGGFIVNIYPTDRDAYEARKALTNCPCTKNAYDMKGEYSNFTEAFAMNKW